MQTFWIFPWRSLLTASNPAFWSSALLFALAAANLLALSLGAYLLYRHFLHRRHQRYQKRCTLELSNLGNIPARYLLRAVQEGKAVNVRFRMGGKPLPGWDANRGPDWVQTPQVAAGAILALDVIVDPIHPYQTRWYPFSIVSRCLSAEGEILPEPISTSIVDACEVHIAGGTSRERTVEVALAAGITVLILLFTLSVYLWFLQPLITG